jgi:hypothetical protein
MLVDLKVELMILALLINLNFAFSQDSTRIKKRINIGLNSSLTKLSGFGLGPFEPKSEHFYTNNRLREVGININYKKVTLFTNFNFFDFNYYESANGYKLGNRDKRLLKFSGMTYCINYYIRKNPLKYFGFLIHAEYSKVNIYSGYQTSSIIVSSGFSVNDPIYNSITINQDIKINYFIIGLGFELYHKDKFGIEFIPKIGFAKLNKNIEFASNTVYNPIDDFQFSLIFGNKISFYYNLVSLKK